MDEELFITFVLGIISGGIAVSIGFFWKQFGLFLIGIVIGILFYNLGLFFKLL